MATGDNIRLLRDRLGLTQEQFVSEIRKHTKFKTLNQPLLSNQENNRETCSPKHLRAYSAYFSRSFHKKISPEDLQTLSDVQLSLKLERKHSIIFDYRVILLTVVSLITILIWLLFRPCSNRIDIVQPREFQQFTSGDIEIKGTCSGIDDGTCLYVFVERTDSLNKEYHWPKAKVINIQQKSPIRCNRKWDLKVYEYPRADDGYSQDFSVSIYAIPNDMEEILINWFEKSQLNNSFPPLSPNIVLQFRRDKVSNIEIVD